MITRRFSELTSMVSRFAAPYAKACALVAFACALCCALAGCGDALSTTQQARDGSASSAAASQSAQPASQQAQGQYQVVVEIDSSNAAAYNSKYPESLGSFTVSIEPGQTVLDALEATGVDYSLRGKDYVSAIGGVQDKACGPNSGWEYLVDGTIPLKSANAYELKGGETVRWAYTVTEGDVQEES